MGKYMKKSKITSDVVGVMEVTSGVRTRAKTHALQLLHSPVSSNPDATSTCYLQLRSRRLEKPASLFNAETKRTLTKEKDSFNCKGASRLRVNSSSTTGDCDEKGTEKLGFKCETEDFGAVKEASSGDNCSDFKRFPFCKMGAHHQSYHRWKLPFFVYRKLVSCSPLTSMVP